MPQLTTRESATIAQESGLILDEVRDLTITDQHSYDRHVSPCQAGRCADS
jgi:hypothetical protein